MRSNEVKSEHTLSEEETIKEHLEELQARLTQLHSDIASLKQFLRSSVHVDHRTLHSPQETRYCIKRSAPNTAEMRKRREAEQSKLLLNIARCLTIIIQLTPSSEQSLSEFYQLVNL